MLNKIYMEQKAMNKKFGSITNMIQMAILAYVGKLAKDRDDETGLKLCKIGMGLTVLSQGLLIVLDVIDLVKMNKDDDFIEE